MVLHISCACITANGEPAQQPEQEQQAGCLSPTKKHVHLTNLNLLHATMLREGRYCLATALEVESQLKVSHIRVTGEPLTQTHSNLPAITGHMGWTRGSQNRS